MPEMERTNVTIHPDLRHKLSALAEAVNRDEDALVDEAISQLSGLAGMAAGADQGRDCGRRSR